MRWRSNGLSAWRILRRSSWQAPNNGSGVDFTGMAREHFDRSLTMAISLQPAHLKRYRDVAWLFMKYGRGDLVTTAEDPLEEHTAKPGESPKATELAKDLETMGPTFVKLGQLLSTRPDLLPVAYIEALTRLQDKVEPFAFSEAERVLREELGVRLSKAFGHIDPVPLAAASLGQVHRATLRDG